MSKSNDISIELEKTKTLGLYGGALTNDALSISEENLTLKCGKGGGSNPSPGAPTALSLKVGKPGSG